MGQTIRRINITLRVERLFFQGFETSKKLFSTLFHHPYLAVHKSSRYKVLLIDLYLRSMNQHNESYQAVMKHSIKIQLLKHARV